MATIKNKRTVTSIGNISVGKSYIGLESAKQVGQAISGVGDVMTQAITDANKSSGGGRSVEYYNVEGMINRDEISSVETISNSITDPKELAILVNKWQTKGYNEKLDIQANNIATKYWSNVASKYLPKVFNIGWIGTEEFGNNLKNFNVDTEYDLIRTAVKDEEYDSITNQKVKNAIDTQIKNKMINHVNSLRQRHQASVLKKSQIAEWNNHTESYMNDAQTELENGGLIGLLEFNKKYEKDRKDLATSIEARYLQGKVTSDNIQIVYSGIIKEAFKEGGLGLDYVKSWIGLINNSVNEVKAGNKIISLNDLDDYGITQQVHNELRTALEKFVATKKTQLVGVNYLSDGNGNASYSDIQISSIEKVSEEVIEEILVGENFGGTPKEKDAATIDFFSTTALRSNYVGNKGSDAIINALMNDVDGQMTMSVLQRFDMIELQNDSQINFGDSKNAKMLEALLDHYRIDPQLQTLPGANTYEAVRKFLSGEQHPIDISSLEVLGASRGGGNDFAVNLQSLLGGSSNDRFGVGDERSFTDVLADGINLLKADETKLIAEKLNVDVSLFGNVNKGQVGRFSQILSTGNPVFAEFIKSEIVKMVSMQLDNDLGGNQEAINYNDIKKYTVRAIQKFSNKFQYDPNSRNKFVLKERMPVTLKTLNLKPEDQETILSKSADKIVSSIENTIIFDKDDLQLEYVSETIVEHDGEQHPVRAFKVYIQDSSGVSIPAYRTAEDGTRKNILWYDKGDIGLSEEELKERMRENLIKGKQQEQSIRELIDPFSFSTQLEF